MSRNNSYFTFVRTFLDFITRNLKQFKTWQRWGFCLQVGIIGGAICQGSYLVCKSAFSQKSSFWLVYDIRRSAIVIIESVVSKELAVSLARISLLNNLFRISS